MLESLLRLVCHRSPGRLLCAGSGVTLLCSRCSGIYAGFLAGMIFHLCLRRKSCGFPPRPISLTACGLILLMAFHAFFSDRLPFLDSNAQRFLTGILCGGSLSLFVYPLCVYFFTAEPAESPVVGNWTEYLELLGILAFMSLIFPLSGGPGILALNVFSVTGLAAIYLTLNMLVAAVFLDWRRKKKKPAAIAGFVAVTILLFLAECLLLSKGRSFFS